MSLYKKCTICCFYLFYRLGKITHSASDYVKQDMGIPLRKGSHTPLAFLITSVSLKVSQLLSAHISILSFWCKVILITLEAEVTDGDQKHSWSSTSAGGITTASFHGGTQPCQISLEQRAIRWKEAQCNADRKLSCSWTVGFKKLHKIIAFNILAPSAGGQNNLMDSAAVNQTRTKTSKGEISFCKANTHIPHKMKLQSVCVKCIFVIPLPQRNSYLYHLLILPLSQGNKGQLSQ